MKRQLGGMAESPVVQALEGKLIAIATAMEQFSDLILPHDRTMVEQFSSLDTRLDEISRAIVATGRTAANAADPMLAQRLEGRLSGLAEQIDLMGREAQRRQQPSDDLTSRIEALTLRIEEMSHAEAAAKLEERLDQLSHLMERSQKFAAPQPELTGFLSDISRKIDALDQGSVNDVLAERLEYLARRIDEIDFHPPAHDAVPAINDATALRIEGRLSEIAARLEESTAAPPTDTQAMRNLEQQISHLSLLMSEPRANTDNFPVEFDRRMSAIEDYMTTNDDYVIEAARQAAEAVVQAYSHNGVMNGSAPEGELTALKALADDLRHLEDLSRSSDERTHRTFEALHDTLVQIANRLDHMETRGPTARMPAAEYKVEPFEYAEAPASVVRAAATTTVATRQAPIIRTSPLTDASASPEPEVTGEPLDNAAKAEIKAPASASGSGRRGKPTMLRRSAGRSSTPHRLSILLMSCRKTKTTSRWSPVPARPTSRKSSSGFGPARQPRAAADRPSRRAKTSGPIISPLPVALPRQQPSRSTRRNGLPRLPRTTGRKAVMLSSAFAGRSCLPSVPRFWRSWPTRWYTL